MPINITGAGVVTGNVSFANTVTVAGATTFSSPVTFSSNNVTIGGSSVSPFTGMRNRIINGAMMIDQRNAGAAVTPASTSYILDRFIPEITSSSALTFQQSSDAPSGFTNSLKITVAASASIVAGTNNNLLQSIEGYNISDLAWGTAAAKPVTISFWIKSSITGTYSLHLRNQGDTHFYIANYTINSANTWEYETITIPGPTIGTWNTTNGRGVLIGLVNLGNGSTFEGTAGSWQAGVKCATSGSVDFCAQANGSTLFITGIQFEVGSTATPFETRPYGMELSLCQRYCYRYSADGSIDNFSPFGIGRYYGTNAAQLYIKFPVTMRYPPSTITVGGTLFVNDTGFSGATWSSPALNERSYDGATVTGSTTTGVTAGNATTFYSSNNSNAYIIFDGEI